MDQRRCPMQGRLRLSLTDGWRGGPSVPNLSLPESVIKPITGSTPRSLSWSDRTNSHFEGLFSKSRIIVLRVARLFFGLITDFATDPTAMTAST